MPSIFVWKADAPIKQHTFVRCFIGENWYMEEHEAGSNSIQYHQQCQLPNDILVWDACSMPNDWIGSTLLDIVTLPYHLIKKDAYATLEQVGMWMRCTVSTPLFDSASLQREYHSICSWITTSPAHEPCRIQFLNPNPTIHNVRNGNNVRGPRGGVSH
jgi:hypothetical protein